ncbi:hypothetical protein [Rhodobacter sp. CZR27]|uniref:hypothetical protein n=1 Tax=Rhodobacter sp. CZR27 TaxID=2033869 RepID=UPI001E425DB3|nr:hypothetical protein [Rhodobacter sp. CZR27]
MSKTCLAATLVILGMQAAAADEKADLIRSAETAAPAAVSSEATIYGMGPDGKMQTLREGTNGYWCMPDDATTPSSDPMCGDANAMEWAMAWINRTQPPADKVGLIFMLAGGSDASNTDPYATAETNDNHWVTTGPHLMIMNATHLMQGYPSGPDPDTKMPFVMWADTPYAHLMVPVE